jgi:IPT/TIG domain/Divergent InlB B-repeat domain
VISHAKASSVGSTKRPKPARRGLMRLAIAASALLAFGLLLAPTMASAASRSLETSFSTSEEPVAIAVDDSNGDTYVSEFIAESVATISRFDSTGAAKNFTAGPSAGTNELSGFGFPFPGAGQVAVDSNSGRIYVTNVSTVEVFENTGEPLTSLQGLSTPGGGEFSGAPCGVAVDQSSGNLYVGSYGGFVWRYTPSGGSIEEADFSGGITTPTATCNVAAAQGIVYAANTAEPGGEVRAFKDADFTAAEPPPSPSSTLIDEGATAVYADSANADLYADKGTEIDVSDYTGADLYSFGSADFGGSFGVAVMPGQTGKAYVSDAAGEEIDVYAPATPAPVGFQLSVDKTGNGTGTVFSTPPGISCGFVCSGQFDEGQLVQLTAGPQPKSRFAGWSTVAGDPGSCTGTTSPCQVTVEEAVELEAEFALKLPAVTGLDPNAGPIAGANTVAIEGTDLGEATEVKFGAEVIDDEDFLSSTETAIEVTAPAHAPGSVDVRVLTAVGESANTAADDYTYAAIPALSSISPSKGPTAGGNLVEITGTDLTAATQVAFGATVVNAPFTENTATKIKVKAPSHGAGAVDVIVTTPGGATANSAADDYTYFGQPAVTSLSPAKGPTAGGNLIEITGLRLSEASKVDFGSVEVACPSASCTLESATKIKVSAPAHAAGTVDVRVTTPGGTSPNVSADNYAYEAPPPSPPSGGGSTPTPAPSPLPAAPIQCVVPKLKGLSLAKARSALGAVHCKAGKVSKPKKAKGPLVVKSAKPGTGSTLPADSKVDLKLAPKPKGKKS